MWPVGTGIYRVWPTVDTDPRCSTRKEGSRRADYPILHGEGIDETYRFREVGHGTVSSRAANGKLPETVVSAG